MAATPTKATPRIWDAIVAMRNHAFRVLLVRSESRYVTSRSATRSSQLVASQEVATSSLRDPGDPLALAATILDGMLITKAKMVATMKNKSAIPTRISAASGIDVLALPAAIARRPAINATNPPETPRRFNARLRTAW